MPNECLKQFACFVTSAQQAGCSEEGVVEHKRSVDKYKAMC